MLVDAVDGCRADLGHPEKSFSTIGHSDYRAAVCSLTRFRMKSNSSGFTPLALRLLDFLDDQPPRLIKGWQPGLDVKSAYGAHLSLITRAGSRRALPSTG
jgi:hypothetical protein